MTSPIVAKQTTPIAWIAALERGAHEREAEHGEGEHAERELFRVGRVVVECEQERQIGATGYCLNCSSCHDGTGASSSSGLPPPPGMLIGELGVVLVPDDLERAALHLVIEPRAAEDQLAQPVDERLVVDERHALPVAYEVAPETRERLVDHPLRRQRDEVGDLVLVELGRLDDPELHGRSDDAALEVGGAEREPIAQELDDVVVARGVVRVG